MDGALRIPRFARIPIRRFATARGRRMMEPKVVALRLIRTVPSDREGRICLAGTFHQLLSSPGKASASMRDQQALSGEAQS